MTPTIHRETISIVVQRQDGDALTWRDSKSFPTDQDEQAWRFRDNLEDNHPDRRSRIIRRTSTLTITEEPIAP